VERFSGNENQVGKSQPLLRSAGREEAFFAFHAFRTA
jgi:hypothetical protein